MQLYEYSAARLSEMMSNKDCSSEEITQSVLRRTNEVEDKVRAYVTRLDESALSQAKAIDKRRAAGESLSPIAGIPTAIKDNICTKGILTTCGSKMLSNFVPPYSATVMDKLETAGIVMTGKTNMDEFAMGSSCETSCAGPTMNPHDLSRVPGGSSGGSAAAVAAGACILSLGSDTGGSVRMPSAYCGTVGLKPTYGTVSRYGAVAYASSLEQVGPICRTVEDTAMLYDVLCGEDKMDAQTIPHPYTKGFAKSITQGVKGKVIGVPREFFGSGVDAEIADAVMAAASVLEKEGAVLKSVSVPTVTQALGAYYILTCSEVSSNLAKMDGVRFGYRAKEYADLNELYEKSRGEGFGNEVKLRILMGTYLLSADCYDKYYKKARLVRGKLANEFDGTLTEIDCLITPTAPAIAPKIGEIVDDPIKSKAGDICTVPINLAGVPALALPCGTGTGGMPIGMQLIGAKFSEHKLFAIGHHYEKISGGFALPKEI